MSANPEEKALIALIEPVMIKGKKGSAIFKARIDTGATKSSIDESLAQNLGLGPYLGEKVVRSANGTEKRPYLEATVEIAGHLVTEQFTVANRSHLRYPILIGKNILRKGSFLIDPNRKSRMFRK